MPCARAALAGRKEPARATGALGYPGSPPGSADTATILGDLLARGSTHGIPAPLLRATYVQLRVYQQRRG